MCFSNSHSLHGQVILGPFTQTNKHENIAELMTLLSNKCTTRTALAHKCQLARSTQVGRGLLVRGASAN